METDQVAIPKTTGAIILPQAVLFPNSYLPLYIFEPRYRTMLAKALEGNRMFAVATRLSEKSGKLSNVGGLGVIRACVTNSDGTSHLILQGLTRVKFLEWTEVDTHPLAEISPLSSLDGCHPENAHLRQAVMSELHRQACLMPTHLHELFQKTEDAGLFADLVAATWVTNPALRLQMMEELSVPRRLHFLLSYLKTTTLAAGPTS